MRYSCEVDVRLILDTPLQRPVPGYEKMQQQDALRSLICGSIAALAKQMTGLLVDA